MAAVPNFATGGKFSRDLGNFSGGGALTPGHNHDLRMGAGVQAGSESFLKRYFPTKHAELPLAQISAYPALQKVLRVWESNAGGSAPATLDPIDLPPPVFPYIMLLDFDEGRTSLTIRLAGDFVREKHGGPVKGKTPYDFFDEPDADQVMAHARQVAESGAPSLATREYIGIDESMWAYTRLMLPLASTGGRIDQIFKVIEPATLNEVGRDPYVA